MARGVVDWMRSHDPEGTAGFRAVKIAVVVTTGLAIGTATGNSQLSLFASFGGMAFLLFAEFPGGRAARFGAYVGLYLVGALLIALGTVMSPVPWLAVTGMAVIGFLILFSGVLSAAIAGGSRALLLAYILPVMVPMPVGEIPSRWAGWSIAAALSIPAALLVWPPRDHDRLRHRAADACAALADQLDAAGSGDPELVDRTRAAATAAVAALRKQFSSSNVRPVGLTGGSRLLMRITDRLEWLSTVIGRLPPPPYRFADHAKVVQACAGTLRAARSVLAQAPRRPTFATRHELSVQLRALHQLHVGAQTFADLVRHPDHREQVPVDQPDGGPVTHPATMLELAYTTRLTGQTVASSAAADARPLIDRLLGRNLPDSMGAVLPARRVLTGHVNLRSVWFQNSVRGAIGLSIAVLIAEITEVSHGFWVVLGAMSVLRTTALNIGSTSVRALGGTLLGFVIGSVLMLAIGTDEWRLWLILPITLLTAAYLPSVVSFAAGQAAFTVLVVVLFNIIEPSGWQVGLIRVEDVLFGCASALISGVLIWPRGAAAAIRSALADFYRQAADAVVAATGRLVGAPTGAPEILSEVGAASLRFDDALREYLFERGTRNVPLESLTLLADGAVRVQMTAEAIAEIRPAIDHRPAAGTADIERTAAATRDWFTVLADRLERPASSADSADPAGPAADPVPTPVAEAAVVNQTRDEITATPADAPVLLDQGRNLWAAALYLDNLGFIRRRLVAPAQKLTAPPRPR